MVRKAAVRKGGAPQKAPGGLDKVLFVRADTKLLEELDRVQAVRSKAAGVVLSRADVARALLKEAIERTQK